MTTRTIIRTIIAVFLITGIFLMAYYTSIQVFHNKNETRITNNQQQNLDRKNNESHITLKLPTVMSNSPQIKDIDHYLSENEYNGTATIYENGQLKLNKGYGLQNFTKNRTNKPDTMYLTGSVQKLTTGIMIKQLEEEHKVDINQSIETYIPWFKTDKPITVKQLIFHKSGLAKYKPNLKYKKLDDAVTAIHKQDIDEAYYNKYRYNDANYLVLAQIIETITGKSFEENFDQRLLKPLHLQHTAFYNNPNFKFKMATGYKLNEGSEQPHAQRTKYLNHYYGAGNLYMTPLDMCKLVYGLQNNQFFNSQVTGPLIHESYTKSYPIPYRYGFYTFADKNRINGKFFGQTFTVYFNNRYIIVLGSNYETFDFKNENLLEYIYKNILNQIGTYNEVGVPYQVGNQ